MVSSGEVVEIVSPLKNMLFLIANAEHHFGAACFHRAQQHSKALLLYDSAPCCLHTIAQINVKCQFAVDISGKFSYNHDKTISGERVC